jgi:hypothetical protein
MGKKLKAEGINNEVTKQQRVSVISHEPAALGLCVFVALLLGLYRVWF